MQDIHYLIQYSIACDEIQDITRNISGQGHLFFVRADGTINKNGSVVFCEKNPLFPNGERGHLIKLIWCYGAVFGNGAVGADDLIVSGESIPRVAFRDVLPLFHFAVVTDFGEF